MVTEDILTLPLIIHNHSQCWSGIPFHRWGWPVRSLQTLETRLKMKLVFFIVWAHIGPFVSQMSNRGLPSSHGRQVSNTFEDFLWLLIILWLLVSTHPNRMWFNSESSSKAGMGNHIPNHQSRTFSANEKHCFVNPPHRRVPRCFFLCTHIKHCCSYSVLTQHGPVNVGTT